MNHHRAVAARFSAAAATYDSHAEVQNEIAGKVAEIVGKLTPPTRVLEVGCGTGAILSGLTTRAVVHGLDRELARRDPTGQSDGD